MVYTPECMVVYHTYYIRTYNGEREYIILYLRVRMLVYHGEGERMLVYHGEGERISVSWWGRAY